MLFALYQRLNKALFPRLYIYDGSRCVGVVNCFFAFVPFHRAHRTHSVDTQPRIY